MNLSLMRKEKLPEKLIAAKAKSKNFNLMDQDIFNEVCDGHIKHLDVKYNFLPVCYRRHHHKLKIDSINRLYGSNYKQVQEIATDPVVAHWAGSDKPWVSVNTLFSNEWVDIYESLKRKGYIDQHTLIKAGGG
jgi:lipopolysaccharide biosynthesis glycosyltransferase